MLMSNHYHLLLETPKANLVAGMRWFRLYAPTEAHFDRKWILPDFEEVK